MKFFFNKNTEAESFSPGRIAWKKLKRNKIGMMALWFIVLTAILSIFGYWIVPDKTPFSNRQVLELVNKKPGFNGQFLRIRKDEASHNTNIFSLLIYGQKDDYEYVPINKYKFEGDAIVFDTYTGIENEQGEERRLPLVDVCYAIEYPANHQLPTTTIDGQPVSTDITLLRKKVEKECLVNKRYLLGSDIMGRDMLSRLVIGARVSLSVGFIAVFISLIIGVLLGALAGYYRGKVDVVISWFINVVWSIPTLLMVIAITFVLGKGFWQVFIAVGLTMWVEVARVVRGQVFSIREKEFVEAAKALGFNDFRIIFKHILPNIAGSIIVISAGNFASAILLEAGLSFLGIGVQPPIPSWGGMIKEHYGYIILDKAYLAILPGLCIMLLVLAFMLLGNALRDALDTRQVEV